jgi:rhodanese-related sulfurtransferase
MQQITPAQLRAWLEDAGRSSPRLLDVREQWEHDIVHLDDSVHMPMQTVPARRTELTPDEDIVVICHHGGRSQQVAMFLERMGHERVYNLAGGVDAWAREVDPSMARY